MELLPGTIIAGKYRVEKVLGRGGMGVVLEATHVQLDARVAIKLILPEMLENAALLERFAREARAAARIRSEHVVRVTDVGTLESGAPYMVMEYLEGQDLEARIKNGGPLPPGQAVDFVLEACEALAEAHALGIVHRDLKSANLFCARRPNGRDTIKLLDFGISKATGEADLGMTGTKMVFGSPYYMSPEQMLSAKKVDARTDIWAMGIVLYELLAGTVPFMAETYAGLVLLVSGREEPDWSPLSHVDADLIQVIRRCLQRSPLERFASVDELSAALRPFASERASSVPYTTQNRSLGAAPPKSATAPKTLIANPRTEAALPERQSTLVPLGQTAAAHVPLRKSWGLVGAAVGALLMAGGAWFAFGSKTAASPEEALSPASPEAHEATPSMPAAPLNNSLNSPERSPAPEPPAPKAEVPPPSPEPAAPARVAAPTAKPPAPSPKPATSTSPSPRTSATPTGSARTSSTSSSSPPRTALAPEPVAPTRPAPTKPPSESSTPVKKPSLGGRL